MTPAAAAEAAGRIVAARRAGVLLPPLPEPVRPADEAEAYQVLELVHAGLAAGGAGPRIGYKIGCTTAVMQRYLGIASPVAAGLFAAGIHRDGAVLDSTRFTRIGIECEIAVSLARDLAAAGGPPSAEAVRAAVAAYMPAVEIVDDRYPDWRTAGAPTLIADDFFSAGCVLGPPVDPAAVPAPSAIVGTTVINGDEAGRGVGTDVMGDPLNAVAWLAAHLAARGRMLRAGEVVLTGSLVETRWLAAGDGADVSITGLGSLRLSVA